MRRYRAWTDCAKDSMWKLNVALFCRLTLVAQGTGQRLLHDPGSYFRMHRKGWLSLSQSVNGDDLNTI